VLRWSVSGVVSSVEIERLAEGLPLQGERDVHPDRDTEYVLIAEGPAGRDTARFTVRVAAQPHVVDFRADPPSITPGQAVTLTWKIDDATSVLIEPKLGIMQLNGSVNVTPGRTTTYRITAEGPFHLTDAKEATVTVTGATRGEITWSGDVRGSEIVTINGNRASAGTVKGALPGLPCNLQTAASPGFTVSTLPTSAPNGACGIVRLVISGKGKGSVTVRWILK
jgi:hypothetical protein